MTRFLAVLFILCAPAFALAGATLTPEQMAAKDAAGKDPCMIVPETITPQRTPEFNGVLQWKRTFGVEGLDTASQILPLADGGFFVIGESRPLSGPDKKPEELQLYILRLDAAGKLIFEKRHKIKGFSRIAGAVVAKDRLYILSQISSDKKESARVDSFDGAGVIQKTNVVLDSVRDVFPQDMIIIGDQLLVALWEKNKKTPDDNLTVLKRISIAGKIISSREYLPGVPNAVHSLLRLPSGGLLAVGNVTGESGVKAGWVMRLDSKDGIVWQRAYPRGRAAELSRAGVLKDKNGFVVVGWSNPVDGSSRAGWVMTITPQGEPVWQTYMTGSYRYAGDDVVTFDDGRVMMLMNGVPEKKGGRAHARVATFDAQGKQLSDESYIEGSNSQALRLINIEGARVIVGAAQTGFASDTADDLTRESTYDAWIAALPAANKFNDACVGHTTQSDDDTDQRRVP